MSTARWQLQTQPRWQFVNRSEDILGWCGVALDLVEVPWRRSNTWTISVSRRGAVQRLDELIGPEDLSSRGARNWASPVAPACFDSATNGRDA